MADKTRYSDEELEEFRAIINEKLKTGTMELMATQLRILSESETPPFPVEENVQTKEELRLKNRTLDLRRPDIQRNLMVKSQVAQLAHKNREQDIRY